MNAERIPLSRGLYALVDAADFADVSRFRWHAIPQRGGPIHYARRSERQSDGSTRSFSLHRHLLAPPDGMMVDHINGNPLDNRRTNLRLASRSQNTANSSRSVGLSGFRGVYPANCADKPWIARIRLNGTLKTVGLFVTQREAALAYDEAAIAARADFARLNFPREQVQ